MKKNQVFGGALILLLLSLISQVSAYNFRRGRVSNDAHQSVQRQEQSLRVHRNKPVSSNPYDLKRSVSEPQSQSKKSVKSDFGSGRNLRDLSESQQPKAPQPTWQGRGQTGMGVMSPSSDPSPFLGESQPGYRRDRNKIPSSPFVSSQSEEFTGFQPVTGRPKTSGPVSQWASFMQSPTPKKMATNPMRPMRTPNRRQQRSSKGKSNEDLNLKPFRGKFYSRGGRPFAIDPGLLKRWDDPRR